MKSPKKSNVSRLTYCQYLLSTQTNYTLTNYAEHVESVSHDMINRYLRNDKLSPNLIWEHTSKDLVSSPNGYIVFDDTVLDKRHSKHIETVRSQYSGNAHSVIRGIGVVTCIYVNPDTSQFWAIDYRIFDPERDGHSKVTHVEDMLLHTLHKKQLPFSTVLVDTWYASNKFMLFVSDLGKLFYCPIKSNRLAR